MTPSFSVILATRDRPGLFAEALQSVMAQDYKNFEIIVVNDGSSHANQTSYQVTWDQASGILGTRFSVHHLPPGPKGHGAGYSHNWGAAQAQGDYLCFLDDDDKWTDPGHLSRVARSIASKKEQGKVVDLYMANQKAWMGDRPVQGPVWLEDLAQEVSGRGRQTDVNGCYEVDVSDLMATKGFCHLNCLIVRRSLFNQIGGMDESIRWEQDRDIYLRLIDQSQCMLHHPDVISFHRVPDPDKTANITTGLGMLEKRLLQFRVLDKAALSSNHHLIRAHARKHKAYALKKIAHELVERKDWFGARFYASQALGAAPGLKWLAFTLFCLLRSLGSQDKDR